MAYSNNNWGGGYTRNYSRQSNWGNRQYSTGRGGSYSPRRGKKHSGAKIVYSKASGEQFISAWNYSRKHGLVTFFVADYKKSKNSVSKNGREWRNVMVKIQKPMAKEEIVSGMLDVRSERVIIKELGIVINPKAPNGGYCGTFVKK